MMIASLQWAVAFIATFFCAVIAAATGTGGGALYMPVFVVLMRDAHDAVPLSKATILGLSIGCFICNVHRLHPASPQKRPLVNFAVAALLEPPTLLGAIFGVLLNLSLPSPLILFLLVICLGITCWKTLNKGIALYRAERMSLAQTTEAISHSGGSSSSPVSLRSPPSVEMQLLRDEEGFDDSAQASATEQNFTTDGRSPSSSNASASTVDAGCEARTMNEPLIAPIFLRKSSFERAVASYRVGGEASVLTPRVAPPRVAHITSPAHLGESDNATGYCPTGYVLPTNVESSAFRNLNEVDRGAFRPCLERFSYSVWRGLNSWCSYREMTTQEAESEPTGSDWRLEGVPAVFVLLNCVVNWVVLYTSGGPRALVCGMRKESIQGWGLVCFHAACIIGFNYYLTRVQKWRALDGIIESDTYTGGYSWLLSAKDRAKFTLGGALAGLCAGALGIGGGLIKGPLMLEMGLNPLAAVATATFMILFTSSSTTLSFLLAGRLHILEGAAFMLLALVAALLGVNLINWLVRKHKLQSLVSFALAGTIGLSMLGMTFSTLYYEVYAVGKDELTDKLFGFRNPCG